MIDGRKLAQEIESVEAVISGKSPRWTKLRNFYRNEPASSTPSIEDGVSVHFPLIQPVIDSLNALVVDTITSETPHCVPLCYGDADAEELQERVLQFFTEKSGLKYALKAVAPIAGYTNRGIIEARWDKDDCSFEFLVIEPESFVCYPTWVDSLADCKFCGHSYYRRRSEIEALQKSGEYQKGNLDSEQIAENKASLSASRNTPSNAVDQADESIKLYRLLVKDGENWKQVVIEPKSGTVLKEEDWTYGLVNYFEFGYKPNLPRDGFYTPQSVANDIQSHQLAVNTLVSDAFNGHRMAGTGMGFAPTGIDTNQSFFRYKAGSFVMGMPKDSQMYFPPVNIANVMPLVELFIQSANESARVSDAMRGQQTTQNKTATQSQYEAMGSQKAVDEYIESFGRGVIGMFRFMHKVLGDNWKDWAKKYAGFLEFEKYEDPAGLLKKPALWSLKVSSIGATVGSQFALVNQLLAMANDPAYKFNKYELGKAIVGYAVRLGVVSAEKFQYEDDPVELMQILADELGEAGVNPNDVIAAIAGAIEMSGNMGGVPGEPMPQTVPGGMPETPGSGQDLIGDSRGGLGLNQSGTM